MQDGTRKAKGKRATASSAVRMNPPLNLPVLAAALRVMNDLDSGRTPAASDLDLVRGSAPHEERDLDLDELAVRVAERCLSK